jgi:hypothetical protein
MNRTFWMAVGAVGGITAYRKGVQVTNRARELGPLGSAQAIAAGTSRVANRTANGLGRLVEARERRAGRLISATAQEVSGLPAAEPIPPGWSAVPEDLSGRPAASRTAPNTTPGKDGLR